MPESSPAIESALFKALPIPVFLLDPAKGVVLAANAAMERMIERRAVGLEIKELLGADELPLTGHLVLMQCGDRQREARVEWSEVTAGDRRALLCVLQLAEIPGEEADLLTGMPPRAKMIEALEAAVAAGQAEGVDVGVIWMDVDELRQVNATLGHDVGDRLLRAIGRRLMGAITSDEIACRVDGDAFVVVVPKVRDVTEVVRAAKRFAQLLEDGFEVGGRSVSVTFSVGVTAGRVRSESLLTKAERAVEQAKANGGNSLRIAEVVSADRLVVQRETQRGLDANEFFLLYQPIVDLRDRRVVGAEAFLRWRRDDGVRQPMDFMRDVDADAELALALGTRVLEIACAQGSKWENSGVRLRMGVNVSLPHFRHPKFIDRLNRIVTEAGMSPSLLEIEVTEATFAWDVKRTSDILDGLNRIGVGLVIDDYGLGILSRDANALGGLRGVKVPRELVAALEGQPGNSAGQAFSSGMALASRVVAVGVESENHNQMLLRMGCPEAQGYFFSRPVNAETFERICMPALAEPIRIIA